MQTFKDFLAGYRPLFLIAYLSICGFICVLSVQHYLGLTVDPRVGLVSMGIIFSIYLLNRFTDAREDFFNDTAKYAFFAERRSVFFAGALVFAASLGFLLKEQKLSAYYLLLVTLGLAYSIRLVPWIHRGKGFVFIRLKEVPLVKNLIISLLWGASVFVVPLLYAGEQPPHPFPVFVLGVALFISTLNNSVFSDIRDRVGDQLAGTRTLPILLGVRRSCALMAAISGGWLLLSAFWFWQGKLDGIYVGFLVLLSLFPLSYYLAYFAWPRRKILVEFLCESDLLLFASGILLMGRPTFPL